VTEHTIEYSLDIDAAAEKVWQILIDFDKFPEWNPMIVKLSGKLTIGEPLHFTVMQANGKLLKLKARFQIISAARELRWGGGLKGILYGEHYFMLEKINEKSCRLLHGETFSGLIISLFWWWLEPNATPLYRLLSDALKEKVEQDE